MVAYVRSGNRLPTRILCTDTGRGIAVLKNVDPLLTGSLLHHLDCMGHGEILALVDRNFPAYQYGLPVVDFRGVDTSHAARAILSVFPLDQFVESPLCRMQIDGRPDEISPPSAALLELATTAEERTVGLDSIERSEFYRRASAARLFVQTGETVGYSCYLLSKGTV
jgi:L-fucose mutarotase